MPTKQRQKIQKRFRKVSFGHILIHWNITRSFGKLFSVRAENIRQMRIKWQFDAKRTSRQNLFWNGRNPLFPTHHMRNSHQMIINHDGTMIGWKSVRFEQNLVIYFGSFEFNAPTNQIIKNNCFCFWNFETNSVFFTICNAFFGFFKRNMTTMPIISWRQFELFLFFFEIRQALWCTKTIICWALITQFMQTLLINRQSFRLTIWTKITSMTHTFVWC